MTAAEAIRNAAARLAGVSDTPRLDAELLMAHAMGLSRETVLLSRMAETAAPAFASLVDRRARHEPLAYITGMRAFWTIELAVTPAVLIPRPDSETLIEAAVDHFRGRAAPGRILDLGTGSGALLLAALDQWPHASGIGVDRSAPALSVARGNAERLGLGDRAELLSGDWGRDLVPPFDLILCNPPYIEDAADLPRDVVDHEPHAALFAGSDGLDDYRRLIPDIARLLAADGVACVEIGATQGDAVQRLGGAMGLTSEVRRDLAGHDRCLILTR